MNVLVTDGKDERFVLLCQKLDECLNDLVGGEKQRVQYVQYNTLDDIHDVVLIMEGDSAVGCGSFKHYDKEIAEVKRVFVNESYRGKRYGRVILENLEKLAKMKGYKKLILETGKPLVSAMHLYQGLGYHIIENYGPYVNMTESVCMEKVL